MPLLDRVNRLENRAATTEQYETRIAALEQHIRIFAVAVENMTKHFDAELQRMQERVESVERFARGVNPLDDIGAFLNGRN